MNIAQYFKLVDVQAKMSLKADASRLFLGYIWWILEPLLFVAMFYVVFEILLQFNRANFLIFLMCGKLPFAWFSKSVIQASNSIIGNAGLIGRIDIPKTMFPMVVVQEGLYKQLAVFALLFGVVILFGYYPTWTWLWLIPIVALNYLMILAFGFVGAVLVCFMRDFSIIISMAMIFLMFTSGIFWDVRSLPDPAMTELILILNPVAFILDAYRQVIMEQQAPDLLHFLILTVASGLLLALIVAGINRSSRWLALKVLTA